MEPLALALMLAATMCWALDQVTGKLAVKKMDVSIFNAIRPSAALPLAVLYVILTGDFRISELKFIFAGVLEGVIGWCASLQLYFYLLKKGFGHRILPISNSHALWGVIFAVLFLGEVARPAIFVSATSIVIGAYFLTLRGDKSGHCSFVMVPLAFLVAAMWGSNIVLSKYCIGGGMTMGTLLVIITASATVSCNMTMIFTHIKSKIKLDKRGIGLSVLSGTLGFFVGQILSFLALRMEKASTLSPLYGCTILFGFILSVLILGERPSKSAILGMIFILIGVSLATV